MNQHLAKLTTSFAVVTAMLTGAFFTATPATGFAWKYCADFPPFEVNDQYHETPDAYKIQQWGVSPPLRFELEIETKHPGWGAQLANLSGEFGSPKEHKQVKFELVDLAEHKPPRHGICLNTDTLPEAHGKLAVRGHVKAIRIAYLTEGGLKTRYCPWRTEAFAARPNPAFTLRHRTMSGPTDEPYITECR